MSTRRTLLRMGSALALTPLAWSARAASPRTAPLVEIWKSPTCGCCQDWIRHLEASGFRTRAFDTGNAEARARLGMPERLGSCHTARVEGYVLEGHVPATDIKRLLRERPKALGLAVPAMPIGSPGMDGPEYGGRRDPYDVLLVAADGGTLVYQHHQ
ncbi:DUF411 domain-containing protein [uncultured Sphaerotilus sp.]|uniref:DUF411 domain-containing protein n=1 Tax=uncultured Sphaerotilus sp. TaxID=474984 RepID=UPI0030CA4614